jgi:hypothetical protein
MLKTLAQERGVPVGTLVANLTHALWADSGRQGEPEPLPRPEPVERKTPRRPRFTMNGQPVEQATPTLAEPTDVDGRGTQLW